MALPQPQYDEPHYYTEAEYLAYDREAEFKHEYHQGEIIVVSGATWNHNLIKDNVSRIMGNQLARRCNAVTSDMRVRTKKAKSYRYPDVVVVCGDPIIEDDNPGSLLNPTVLVEVLSESTQTTDHVYKLEEYLQIESLQAYLIVAQDEAHIKIYQRTADEGVWQYNSVEAINGEVRITSIEATLPLMEIYRNVSFELAAPPESADSTDDNNR
ncbi:MAG: Uma2 family endonuclease [Chloroflexota bacterium]